MAIPYDELTALRHELHAHPELSCEEHNTRERVIRFLEHHDITHYKEVGDTGLIVVFDSETEGPTVMIRGDMDALPIHEVNDDLEYRSYIDGVSHMCGHDGHTTIIAGLALHLKANPISNGRVVLLFQPAEENGHGAQSVVDDPEFKKLEPDWVFALHNLPGYPLHKLVYREGIFTAAAKSIIVKLHGKTSHAAEPELGVNPGLAVAEILQATDKVSQPDLSKDDFFLVTPVYLTLGEKAYGISAGYAEVHLTLRSWNNEVMEQQAGRCEQISREIGEKHGLKVEIDWTEVFFANINGPEAVHYIETAAQQLGLDTEHRDTPFKWGEDFGLFTDRYRGAMFGLGAGGESPALHNPDYDFPDELIETGVTVFRKIIDQILS